jgi:intracellular multiplication protein IcmC
MLPLHLQVMLRTNGCRIFWLLVPALCASSAYAADPGVISALSAEDMIINIATQLPALMRMVTALAYVLGMYFMFQGLLKLKEYGEARTMMSQQHSMKAPLIYLIIGALLIYLPTTVSVSLNTFWTDPNPYAYIDQQSDWSQFWNVCFVIVQFVGVIAFIRGLVILSHLSTGGQQGEFGRGVTHIIGGVFCINIYQFVQMIFVTLGISV